MLRLINILILFIASAATAAASTATAGDFDCRWLSHPTPDDTSHVWFSRTIVTSEKDMPRAAYIRVATTGRFVLYVNGRNVSTALFTPDRQKGDTAVAAIAYDVQRFLRTDTNTIALLYCPSMRTHRQVSVCFYGIAADSSHFAVSGTDRPCFALNGNAGWLCRHADTWQTHDGGEAMNRNLYPYRWTDANQPLAMWQAVEETSPPQHHNTSTPQHNTTPQRHNITTPRNTTASLNTSTPQHNNTTPPHHHQHPFLRRHLRLLSASHQSARRQRRPHQPHIHTAPHRAEWRHAHGAPRAQPAPPHTRHPARLSPRRAHPHRQPAVRLHGRNGRASLHALLAHRPEHRNHQRRPPLLLRTSAGSGEHLPVDGRTFTRSSLPEARLPRRENRVTTYR